MLLIKVWETSLILIVWEAEVGFGVKWIGPNEKFLCRCKDEMCIDSGKNYVYSCEVQCQDGYFNFDCQYGDVTFSLNQTYPEITDYSDKTCIENNGTLEVRINIQPSIIRSIYITFRDKADMNNTVILYETGSGFKQCNQKYIVTSVHAPSKIRYFVERCLDFFYVESIIINGSAAKDLCSVYVARGRNMAVKAAVGQAGTELKLTRDWAMTDGDVSLNEENCTSISLLSTNPVVHITFDFPVDVDSITLTIGSGNSESLAKYHLMAETENRTIIWRQETPAFYESSKSFFQDNGMAEVSRISIMFQNLLQTSSELNICELEAFGDCVKGKYGLACENNCSARCKDRLCIIDGSCLQCSSTNLTGSRCCSIYCAGKQKCELNGRCTSGCITGYYGDDCINACSISCKRSNFCNLRTGYCIDGCKSGFWDKKCFKKCTNCNGNGSCEIETGDCLYGCKAGFWETNCTKECANCNGNGSCEIETGDCLYGCKAGFWETDCTKDCSTTCGGDSSCDIFSGDCNDGCVTFYWGSKCSQKCSEFCDKDGTCDINGTCINGCKTGYFGYQCNNHGVLSENGNLACHCADGICSNKTEMCPTVQCVKGWFAQSCQYRDAGAYAQMSHPDVNDNNDSTCYESPNNTVTARWNKEFEVSWVRLVLNVEANVSHFDILYDLQTKRKLCKSPSALNVPNRHNVYDLDCFVFVPARQVTVTWYGKGSLCTFNICHVPSFTDPEIEVLMLKNYTTIERKINLTLENNKTVHEVNFNFETLTKLHLRFLAGQTSICEIELRGECADGTYGLHCDGVCRFTCFRNRCTFDGRCFDCVLGRIGTHCEIELSHSFGDEESLQLNETNIGLDLLVGNTLQGVHIPYFYIFFITAGVLFLVLLSSVRYYILDDSYVVLHAPPETHVGRYNKANVKYPC